MRTLIVPLVVLAAGAGAAFIGYRLAKQAVEPAPSNGGTSASGIGAVVLTPKSDFEKWYTAEGILDSLG